MLLISTLLILLILYFCGRQIITSISILAINIFIGYYVLFLLCSYLMERKKFVNQKELFDYYKLTGIPMIILSSFKEFGKNILDVQNKIFFFKRKRSYKDDRKKIFLKLINILNSEKSSNGISYDNLVIDCFNEKWNYYYHSRYIGNILDDINNLCKDNNLSPISIIVTHPDGKISENFVKYNKDYIKCFNIKGNDNISDNNVQNYINDIRNAIMKYTNLVEKI